MGRKTRQDGTLRITAEGRVWEVVHPELYGEDFTLSVRRIAARTGLSVGAVHKTRAWRVYQQVREMKVECNRRQLSERSLHRENR